MADTLGPAWAGPGLHDDHFQPAIRLDAVHQTARHHAGGDVLAADRPADLFLTIPGLAGGPVRAEAADWPGRAAVGPVLGAGIVCPFADHAVPDLWTDWRPRHRHRVCRRRRPDRRLVVPRAAGPRRGRGRGGLRDGGDPDDLPDHQLARCRRLPDDAAAVRRRLRGDWAARGARPEAGAGVRGDNARGGGDIHDPDAALAD